MVRVGSAAWVTAVVVVTATIIGAFMVTVIDPFAQAVFDSTLYVSTTTDGNNALRWQQQAWAFLPVGILIYLTVLVWTKTRRGA